MTDDIDRIMDAAGIDPDELIDSPARTNENAERLIANVFEDGQALRTDGPDLWSWHRTHWEPLEKWDVEATVTRWLKGKRYFNGKHEVTYPATRPNVASLKGALFAQAQLLEHPPPDWMGDTDPAGVLSFANGLLDMGTGERHDHHPGVFTKHSVPFAYDPQAQLDDDSLWMRFLATGDQALWPNDPESVRTLQEWFGYVLSSQSRLQKMLFIVGPKRAGKGTISHVLSNLIGEDRVVGLLLSSFANDFGLEPMIGKPLAVVDDARLNPNTSKQAIERLLTISGEGRMEINRKHRSHWSGVLPTRLMMLSNEVPQLSDASGAITSRFVILTLKRTWFGQEDPTLKDRLMDELPAIVNWALDGYRRLQARGGFREPKTSRGNRQTLEDLGSPIKAFIRDCAVMDQTGAIQTLELFKLWSGWAMDNNIPAGGVAVFGRNLSSAQPEISKERRRDGDKRVQCYVGIRARRPDEADEEPQEGALWGN